MFPLHRIIQRVDIRPFSGNPRTHSLEQIAQLAASIREFGWTNPLLVDAENNLIAGHGRLAAADRLGLAELPAIVLEGLTEAQKAALRIADNKLALNAGWDEALLSAELGELRDTGFDLALTGFGEDELADLFASRTAGLTDPDEAPAAPTEPISKPGDVWLLGRHRLVCGDATSEIDVSIALAGVRPHLMVTDPPYGVDYDPDWRNRAPRAGSLTHTIGATAIGRVDNDTRSDWSDAWALFSGDVAYVWHGALHAAGVVENLAANGFDVRAQIIWVKDRMIIGRGHYHWHHEPCWYAVRSGGTGHWTGDRKQTTVWEIAHRASETGHSTQKPVECMRRPIENNSSPGQAVYDPFVGSGTTIIAAEMTGRACHAIEISPQYCDIAVIRWQNFTGNEATNSHGEPFGALSEIRAD